MLSTSNLFFKICINLRKVTQNRFGLESFISVANLNDFPRSLKHFKDELSGTFVYHVGVSSGFTLSDAQGLYQLS